MGEGLATATDVRINGDAVIFDGGFAIGKLSLEEFISTMFPIALRLMRCPCCDSRLESTLR